MQQLKVIENFFDFNEIKFIKDYAEDLFESREIWKSSKTDWQKGLNTSPNDILIYNLNKTIDSKIYSIIQEKTEKDFNLKIKAINFFFYLNQSNINWHNDGTHGGGATIYLNEKWKKEYGGFFIYEKDNKFGIELPKFNKCIFQCGGIEHATTLTSKDSPVRKILQVFFKNE